MWGEGISYRARLFPISLLSIENQNSCTAVLHLSNNGGLFYLTECPVRDL